MIVLGNVVINEEPEYLLVLYLTKKGDVYEVNNGRGKASWESERSRRVIGS